MGSQGDNSLPALVTELMIGLVREIFMGWQHENLPGPLSLSLISM